MHQTSWVLLDTETTGIKPPVYVVELAAQRMRGWAPEGPSFVRLLNHGVDIPPETARVNGYTPEILERDGEPPLAVYDAFAAYVGNRPLVAYNLSYDLDDVLRPEWQRLGREPIGRAGFCALRLAQRLLDPVPAGNCKLQTLRQYYRLPARGAHTALGDVETVVDLLQQVLRPLAEERGLNTWAALIDYTTARWFPSRIPFGKFKGRWFREAHHDADLRAWIEWLSGSNNPRSAEMGAWYLQALSACTEIELEEAETIVVDVALPVDQGLVLYRNPEKETLVRLIDSARARLAELEAEFASEHHAVEVVQARLFNLLRPYYERRDILQLIIEYRRKYLDILLIEGDEAAEEVEPVYQQARDETKRDYQDAAAEAAGRKELSAAEERELKVLFRKLVRLYHPDRFAHDPTKQAIYDYLMQDVNQARDRGDIQCLREIANDPNGFLARHGGGSLDFEDEADLIKLRQLYESLQVRVLETLEALGRLRESREYELYRLSRERPDFLETVAEQQAAEIRIQVAALEDEARQLAEEIESLTGVPDQFAD